MNAAVGVVHFGQPDGEVIGRAMVQDADAATARKLGFPLTVAPTSVAGIG